MNMLKEFKEFAVKGNVVDMAVGFIMGVAFQGVVKSIVDDLMMPLIGAIGSVDFKNNFFLLKTPKDGADIDTLQKAAAANIPVFAYGQFLTVAINFVIVAFCAFLLVKGINMLKRKQDEAPAAPPKQEVLLTEIRDLLAKR